ncbi:hypothetical protein F4604DRAFT_737369 [Suillus subluteus]|nr:hypothetical protein F4604DRAFT_737369 [Suillus subluteus]
MPRRLAIHDNGGRYLSVHSLGLLHLASIWPSTYAQLQVMTSRRQNNPDYHVCHPTSIFIKRRKTREMEVIDEEESVFIDGSQPRRLYLCRAQLFQIHR